MATQVYLMPQLEQERKIRKELTSIRRALHTHDALAR